MYKLKKFWLNSAFSSERTKMEFLRFENFILDDDNGKLNGGSDDISRGPRRHG